MSVLQNKPVEEEHDDLGKKSQKNDPVICLVPIAYDICTSNKFWKLHCLQ